MGRAHQLDYTIRKMQVGDVLRLQKTDQDLSE